MPRQGQWQVSHEAVMKVQHQLDLELLTTENVPPKKLTLA